MFWNDRAGVVAISSCEFYLFSRHGSNVAGLETTATFDLSSNEFVINTTTLTATKWWIGGAAETATHW